MRKIGIGLTMLVALFWIMDAAMKLTVMPQVADTIEPLGWPADPATILTLGAIQAVCLILYLVPRTAILGAIFATRLASNLASGMEYTAGFTGS